MKKVLTIFIIALASLTSLHAQFNAGVTFGLSANQINGDNLAGFNKLGLLGGVTLYYPIRERLDVGLELLYAQRGSAPKIDFNTTQVDATGIHLDYLEIPLILRIKDWYNAEDEYYKAYGDIGISTGYLFRVKTRNTIFNIDDSDFSKLDFTFILGAGMAYTKRIHFGLRYTRSMLPLYDRTNLFEGAGYTYNWNFKASYIL